MPPQKCPVCNSSKFTSNKVKGKTLMRCQRCGFTNESGKT